RLMRMHANKRQRLERAQAGDIVAATGLKNAATGDTLCDPAHPIRFETIACPEPVINLAVEPMTNAEQDKLQFALDKLAAEDPTLQVQFDEERGHTILSGMGELHLEVLIRRLADEFQLKVGVGKPQVVYRETIEGEATCSETFDREIAGRRQVAEVTLAVAPAATGAGIEIAAALPEASQPPDDVIDAARQGVLDAASSGVVQGYPVVDVRVELRRLNCRDDSTPLAFRIAAGQAFHRALEAARPVLLEPVMRLEILVPEAFVGGVISGLQSRRGVVEGIDKEGFQHVLKALVPLAETFGYTTDLRSASQGRASFSMQFSHYAAAP
ncbi:MAG: elongation factor G, partial [Candidatus Tectomicrobia bacterium]|nr:elongation factor G [Candidatus Tectomicrobia bacterium]